MKKIILTIGMVTLISSLALATEVAIWIASHTATADTTKQLCTGSTPNHGIIHGVCVNTSGAGTMTIYNSSYTAVNIMTALTTTTTGCFYYDMFLSSGVVYSKTGTADSTILYQCY
jgi:hypothetical protein